MSTHASLVDLAEDSVHRFAERPLFGMRRDGAWSWISYAEFGTLLDEVRGGLASLGVHEGDRVAIVSRNSTEWAAAAYATYGLGATFVPMYEAQRPAEWEFILRDCGASIVLARSSEITAALDEMRPRLPALRHVIAIEAPPTDGRSMEALRRTGREHPAPAVHPEAGALAGLVYTSGTTGQPKGVMLSHGNLVTNIEATTSVFPVAPDDRTVSFLPWAHVYGQVVELHLLLSVGASTAFNTDTDRLVEDLSEVHPTILVAVPRIFNRIHAGVRAQLAAKPAFIRNICDRGLSASVRRRRGERLSTGDAIYLWLADRLVFSRVRARFGGRLKYVVSASATLSPVVGEFIDAIGLDVYEGYGLTETSPVVATNRPDARKLGTVGRAIPGVTIRIDESRSDTPGRGEIVVYGPNVMMGYLDRPEENAKTFTSDGGLRTGDIGYIDADGFLSITGRIKEQYKLENGKYVMPSPLEQQLSLSPFISNVMLYGQDHPYNVALVVVDPAKLGAWAAENNLTAEGDLTHLHAVHDLIEKEIERLSADFRGYERPKAFVLTSDGFSVENGLLTPTMKVKRRQVAARYGAELEALYQQGSSERPSEPSRLEPVAPAGPTSEHHVR